jgi:hypothetical protein
MRKIIMIQFFAFALSMYAYAQYPVLRPSTSDSTVLADLKTGLRYMSGDSLVEKDFKEAVKYLRKAAQQDEVAAQYFLGIVYEKGGYGIKRNVQQALHWFEKCANNGVDQALYQYGLLLFKNEGNPSNYRKAVECFTHAAENGNLNGVYGLGYMHLKGLGVEQNYSEAFSYFYDAASQQHLASIHCLGYCYENGFGVEESFENAMHAYRFAASKNYEQAIIRINEIEGTGVKSVSIKDNEKLEADFIDKGLHSEHFFKNSTINISSGFDIAGNWEGILYTYDWAGNKIMKRQNIEMKIDETGAGYSLELKADYTQTFGTAKLDGNKLEPDELSLVVKDPLDQYNDLNILSIILDQIRVDGQVYLTGSIESFNPTHQEPGAPAYMIIKKLGNDQKDEKPLEPKLTKELGLRVYPNPFQNSLNVSVSLKEQSTVEVNIYDLQGRLVTTMLQKTTLQAGEHNFVFDEVLPEGMYIFDLKHDNEHHVKRLIKN